MQKAQSGRDVRPEITMQIEDIPKLIFRINREMEILNTLVRRTTMMLKNAEHFGGQLKPADQADIENAITQIDTTCDAFLSE
ncbi:MAG: hypothetical protein ABIJ33_05055 [Patescibacteria group bacterium]